jgi:fatty acid desaturase
MAQSYADPATVKRLSVLTPWRTVLAVGLDWAVIAVAIAISQWAHHPLAYLLAVAVIGGRMHAFGVLLHDFAHHRFIANKRLSDWFCDLALAWPLLTTVDSYRQNHLPHHRYTNTARDPDWVFKLGRRKFTFPQPWQHAIIDLLSYLVVVGSIMDVFGMVKRLGAAPKPPLAYRVARLSYYLALAALFTWLGIWTEVAMYWIAPYFTAFFLLMHIRSVAEHFGSMDYSHELSSTRTVKPYGWERAFFAPHQVNYHIEHHLYPSVPFYNLPALHRALMANPAFSAQAHFTRGYSTGLVRETILGSQAPAT